MWINQYITVFFIERFKFIFICFDGLKRSVLKHRYNYRWGVKTQPPTSLQANPNSQRLLQVHILSLHHSPLERPPILHPCLTYCGTIQSCCVPSGTHLTIDIRCAFTFLLTLPFTCILFLNYSPLLFNYPPPLCTCIPNPV